MTVGLLGMSTGETYDWYYGTEHNALYWAGALTFSLYFVYSCVRPFNYQRTWNARLARGLKTVNLSVLDPGGMSFDLTRTPQGSEWAMGLSLVSFEY
jgi:hypothetical protein